ncbi:MAG: long-chain-fatty-acid--CoA ligase [Xanthobacteraceae bacterium]|nr:long-chain-fatty-acid--CoA ligase [Xanthobacteraceae bacterium]QYK46089.1 MAG: long-chain-fatty-acid--CoA ligase [Xanthobacteraceae bacterium]
MNKIWLKKYPKGVGEEVNPDSYTSLVQVLEESFAKYRDRKAFISMDKSITYGDLDAHSNALGAYLQSLGLKKGDRVAIMMPNVMQYPIAISGVLRAGLTVVNVNPLYTPRELEHQLKDSGASAIIILENFASTLQKVLPNVSGLKHVILANLGDMLGFKGAIVNFVVRKVKKMVPAYSIPNAVQFLAAISEGKKKTLSKPQLGPQDIAFLQYTGGTTGVSKGAILTHRNVIANVLQNDAWLQPVLEKEPKVEQLLILTALPLYHIFALTACFFLGTRAGACCLLIANPRDLPALIKELQKYKVTTFPAVNTLYNALLNHPDFDKIDWSMLKVANGGGMAVQKAVADKWLAKTGVPILEGYGLSETAPVLTCNPGDNTAFNGSIGLPVPSTIISIRDDEGKELAIGEVGEITAKGPQVMPGYWQRPEETAKVMTKDGFFRTGDIGRMDEDGYVYIVDRKKDMVNVSGFNVYPNEVEGVMAMHPGVLECAVIGVPDANSGEAVKLFVVKKDPNVTEQELMKFAAENLTGYKKPKYIEFRADLPKTNVGKILRRELRDLDTSTSNKAA